MKNFPHQVNAIPKLRHALRVASQLLEEGAAFQDDSIYGYALARAGVYSFRGLEHPTAAALEARIAEERAKIPGNQGARTFARDIRRTLLMLGFLVAQEEGGYTVSAMGDRVLTLPEELQGEAKILWMNAILGMDLGERQQGASMHPATAMLRLVDSIPRIEKRWLAFGMDVNDDSDPELARVTELIRGGNFARACEAVGASEFDAANAVKIIPSLLEQVGLLQIAEARCELTDDGRALLLGRGIRAVSPPRGGVRRARPRPRREGLEVHNPDQIPLPGRDAPLPRTPEEQSLSALLLQERSREHQEIVRRTADALQHGGQLARIWRSDDAFDLLGEATNERKYLLFEIKTVRGDALLQARTAVGQLFYYEYFDVLPRAGEREVVRVAVFNEEPGEETRAYLQHCGCLCAVFFNNGLRTIPPELRAYFPE